MNAAETMAYAGYCPDCGRMVAASVDTPTSRKDTAKFVAELIRDGVRVERIAVLAVRASAWGCSDECGCATCVRRRKAKAPEAQADLLAEPAR